MDSCGSSGEGPGKKTLVSLSQANNHNISKP